MHACTRGRLQVTQRPWTLPVLLLVTIYCQFLLFEILCKLVGGAQKYQKLGALNFKP